MIYLQPAWQGEKNRVTPSSEQVGSNLDPARNKEQVVYSRRLKLTVDPTRNRLYIQEGSSLDPTRNKVQVVYSSRLKLRPCKEQVVQYTQVGSNLDPARNRLYNVQYTQVRLNLEPKNL